MTPEDDYVQINKALWNKRVGPHLKSEFYKVEESINGASSLNQIERELLGDIRGKSVLHLQCHFGQDSISLARMGAKVTGVDLSDAAIEAAKVLSKKCAVNADFICCDIYDLPQHLDKKFDIVFTSYGTIGWLPDLNKWATIINRFLNQNGVFVFVEFHPVVWMFDNDFRKITYSYFKDDAIVEMEASTYADSTASIEKQSVSWNHGLAEVATSLLAQDLIIKQFNEYNYSPYNIFSDMYEFEPSKFRIKSFQEKIPLVYSLLAAKTN